MRLAVFGAAGRTGRHVVELALGHGHDVRAFVHTTPLELHHERLTVVPGDVSEFEAVASAISGCTAVAFAVGRSGGGHPHLHEDGIANVIHAMAERYVTRLAAVSAAGAFARSDKRLSLAYRARIATTSRAAYDDLEAMERRIMASDLDWTIVRPGGMSDEPATGHYRLSLDGSLLANSHRVSRADVAALILKALETDIYWRRTVVIGGYSAGEAPDTLE